jgi:ribose transport system ATP-binding protein/rhamnose transport system ATP-binding protein
VTKALEALGVSKSYGGVVALQGANFTVRAGSVHALLGQNGAGKSTLVKIMTGAIRPDQGSLRLTEADVCFRNTADAAARGVAVVAQELSLFPHFDILDNLFPMREPRLGPLVDRRRMRERAIPVLEELGLTRPLHTPISELSLAERQLVEIAKALVSKPKVLLLDEPTSALETAASGRLVKILSVLREHDVGVVYVSHILEEAMSLCDEVTILRDGRAVISGEPMANLTMDTIVATMLGIKTGRSAASHLPKPTPPVAPGNRALVVAGVSTSHGLRDVSFGVAAGEVVGLAGLAGSGPEAMLAAISGLSPIDSGEIVLPEEHGRPGSLREAIRCGVAYVSGDRRKLGLMLDKPIWENIVQVRSIGIARDGYVLGAARLRRRAAGFAARFAIKTHSVLANAGSLSGGNQQKVVLAKWMDAAPTILLLDDPTRGVDIGARAEITSLLHEAAAAGAVVIYLSTDLEELVSACHRVLVFHRGGICAEVAGDELTSVALLGLMNTGSPVAARTTAP